MIDLLALPGLAILVVAFLVYIWVGWLKDESGRALRITGEEDDTEDPPHD